MANQQGLTAMCFEAQRRTRTAGFCPAKHGHSGTSACWGRRLVPCQNGVHELLLRPSTVKCPSRKGAETPENAAFLELTKSGRAVTPYFFMASPGVVSESEGAGLKR